MTKQITLRLLIAIAITLSTSAAALAQLEFFNEKGVKIGMIFPDGKVVDARERHLGNIGHDGKVVDPQGRALGSIAADGSIANARNQPIVKTVMGRGADANPGRVVSPQNAEVFQIMPDGRVVGPKSQQIASVKGNVKVVAEKTAWRAATPDDIKNMWSSAFFIFFDKTVMEKTTLKVAL